MNQTLAASIACDTIRAETAEQSDARVYRTGQVAVLLLAVSNTRVPRYALELMAGERGITLAQLSREILRPLVQRGFIRTAGDEIVATPAAVACADSIGAWMDGTTLASVRKATLRAEQVRVGDVIDTGSRFVRVDSVLYLGDSIYTGSVRLDAGQKVSAYRAA
jgi:hypothetical protein